MPSRSILVTVATVLVCGTAQAQQLPGYRYSVRMTSEAHDGRLATVRDAGDRSRLDFDTEGGYLLVLENGRRVVSVHPRDREYSEAADTGLERPIGNALHTLSRTGLVDVQVNHFTVTARRLGDGGMVAGRSTQHYRLTQDFDVTISALGHPETTHQVVVIDYWVDPTLRLTRNPFLELLTSAQSVLAQQSAGFENETARARAGLFQGAPLRVVVTRVEDHENREESLVLEVTGLERTTFPPSTFAIPPGYQRNASRFNVNFGTRN